MACHFYKTQSKLFGLLTLCNWKIHVTSLMVLHCKTVVNIMISTCIHLLDKIFSFSDKSIFFLRNKKKAHISCIVGF